MSFCESPKNSIKRNADAAKQEQGPEHKGKHAACGIVRVVRAHKHNNDSADTVIQQDYEE